MHRLVALPIVVVGSTALSAVLTGGTWFLVAYAQHRAAFSDRGFFTVGRGFAGLLGANIGLVQGALVGTRVGGLSLSRLATAMLGATISGVVLLMLSVGFDSAWAAVGVALTIGTSMAVGWSSVHLLHWLQPSRKLR